MGAKNTIIEILKGAIQEEDRHYFYPVIKSILVTAFLLIGAYIGVLTQNIPFWISVGFLIFMYNIGVSYGSADKKKKIKELEKEIRELS